MNDYSDLADLRGSVSQEALAEMAGVSRHVITRNEQTLWKNPSANYVSALSDVSGHSPQDIIQTYQYVRTARVASASNEINYFLRSEPGWMERFENIIETRFDTYLRHPEIKPENPFVAFRAFLMRGLERPDSQVHFCIFTCFHPGQLATFENNGQRIPSHLRGILSRGGFKDTDLSRLEGYIVRYRSMDRSRD